MSARAILNKVEPQIKALSDTLQDVKLSLRGTDACVQDVVDAEERLQDRMDFIEEQMRLLKEHLNTAIKRINDIHRWVDNLVDKDNLDLRCHEEFDFAELSDNE